MKVHSKHRGSLTLKKIAFCCLLKEASVDLTTKTSQINFIKNWVKQLSQPRRHTIDRHASTGRTMDGRPYVDWLSVCRQVPLASIWQWPLTSESNMKTFSETWNPFQQCPLTCQISVPCLTEIPPVNIAK